MTRYDGAVDDPTRPLRDPLKRFLKASGMQWLRSHADIADTWAEAVPEEIARETRPVAFRSGTLTVLVASAACKSELEMFQTEMILESLRAVAPDLNIRKLRFRLAEDGDMRQGDAHGEERI